MLKLKMFIFNVGLVVGTDSIEAEKIIEDAQKKVLAAQWNLKNLDVVNSSSLIVVFFKPGYCISGYCKSKRVSRKST